MIAMGVPGLLWLRTKTVDWNIRNVNIGLRQIPGGLATNLCTKPNFEFGGARCQVSNIWYPTSMLRVDGWGRTVGVDY